MKPEVPPNPKGLPGAQVAQVLELVNYQDGAVVSREVVKKTTGSVTAKPSRDAGKRCWKAAIEAVLC